MTDHSKPPTWNEVEALIAPLELRLAALEGVPVVKRPLEVEEIQATVANRFRMKIADMTSERRPDSIARPRQIAMYFSKMFTRSTLREIGRAFGNRGHGAVIHACKAVDSMILHEEGMRDVINELRAVLVARIQ